MEIIAGQSTARLFSGDASETGRTDTLHHELHKNAQENAGEAAGLPVSPWKSYRSDTTERYAYQIAPGIGAF
jgi:hypothetical protein